MNFLNFFCTICQLLKQTLFPARVLVVALAILTLSGCSTVGYYSQIVSGHMRIVMGKRPLAEVVADENIDDSIKRRLSVAQRAREFAIKELGLPDNNSYTSFYDTGRRFVTWNVVAAEEFSFKPHTWCFPIAGCVSYRGYYAQEDAQEYADTLADEGMDVALVGATAYSTLGWFKDPLLNTMLARSDPSIASLLFHELAHQQLYVGDDSKFNESYASFIEKQGLKLWEANEVQNGQQSDNSQMSAQLEARLKRRDDFIALLSATRDDLEALYKSEIDIETKRERKRQRFEQLLVEYEELKGQLWDGYQGYDGWFSRELNNARLVSIGTYNDYIPAFEVMFNQSGGSLAQFYAVARDVAEMPAEKRTQVMQDLLSQSSLSDEPSSAVSQ